MSGVSKKQKVFSLSRFFHKGVKPLPCFLAGRFFPQKKSVYELRSQGLKIEFENPAQAIDCPKGTWLKIYLTGRGKGGLYRSSRWEILSLPQTKSFYREESFFVCEKSGYFKKVGAISF